MFLSGDRTVIGQAVLALIVALPVSQCQGAFGAAVVAWRALCLMLSSSGSDMAVTSFVS